MPNTQHVQSTNASYDRVPSGHLKRLVSSGGILESLPGLNHRRVAGTELDVHLRVADEVQVYCGLTRLLVVRRTAEGTVAVSAHRTYREHDCGKDIFRDWRPEDSADFRESLDRYVASVSVNRRHVAGEGAVQSLWSRVAEPWVSFDREAVLSYPSPVPRRIADGLVQARQELQSMFDRERWDDVPKVGNKLDRLAVDSDGRLVLLELKNAGASSASVFYSPYQLLHYVWEWHCALEIVRPQLQALIDARVELGLTSPSVMKLTGDIRPAIGFGPDRRSASVKHRYGEVLRICNEHRPPGVPCIETWAIEDDASPARVGSS